MLDTWSVFRVPARGVADRPKLTPPAAEGRCQVARVDRPAVPGPNGPGHSRPRWNAHGAGQQAPGTPGQTGNSRWMPCVNPMGRLRGGTEAAPSTCTRGAGPASITGCSLHAPNIQ